MGDVALRGQIYEVLCACVLGCKERNEGENAKTYYHEAGDSQQVPEEVFPFRKLGVRHLELAEVLIGEIGIHDEIKFFAADTERQGNSQQFTKLDFLRGHEERAYDPWGAKVGGEGEDDDSGRIIPCGISIPRPTS